MEAEMVKVELLTLQVIMIISTCFLNIVLNMGFLPYNFGSDIIKRFLKYYTLYFTYHANENLYQLQSLAV